MWDDKIFRETLYFALKAHGNQKMKGNDNLPYSAHFVPVMMNAVKYSLNETDIDRNYLIQLALLHDVIEDTSYTYNDIKNKFGEKVADGVLALSRDENIKKDLQIKDCIKRIKANPKEVAIVKLADRLYNVRGRVLSWSLEKQELYKIEAEFIKNELGYACENLKIAIENALIDY